MQPIDPIQLISAEDLARRLGYAGANNAFRDWCAQVGIKPVPGRRGFYDPVAVRRRLDVVQGLADATPDGARPMSLVEKRRARRGGAA